MTAEDVPTARGRLGLALGGGAARGLAHIGVLDVLEREGIRPDCIAGSSMGGLIGALSASGLRAKDMLEVARDFRFPRWFVLGRVVKWENIFPSAARLLAAATFEGLEIPLIVTAVDLESGDQVILNEGPVLPAVRATCTVPGILRPVAVHGRWLVDGGVLNVLPVDVAWMLEPDVVVAVNVGGPRTRRMPQLGWRATSALSWLGAILPNPATARMSFEVLTRASEIVLSHQTELAAAMTGPEVLIEPRLHDLGLRDFHRLDEAVDAGRRAAEAMLPRLRLALDAPARPPGHTRTLFVDPVCRMVVSPDRARALATYSGETYYFCSENCRDCFDKEPGRYLGGSTGTVLGRGPSR
jgi:NTE family protein